MAKNLLSSARKKIPWIDPDDASEWTNADFVGAEVRRGDVVVKRSAGRPKGSGTKELISLRLDRDLIATLKATGAGWQTRVNQSLRASMMSKPVIKRSAIKKSGKGGRPRKEAR
jgi:uncharacterized protein (DUF4415 family)